MGAPHVAHSEKEAVFAIATADDSSPAEEQGVRSSLRLRQLGEDDACSEGLDENAHAALRHEDADAEAAVCFHATVAVADGLLRFE